MLYAAIKKSSTAEMKVSISMVSKNHLSLVVQHSFQGKKRRRQLMFLQTADAFRFAHVIGYVPC